MGARIFLFAAAGVLLSRVAIAEKINVADTQPAGIWVATARGDEAGADLTMTDIYRAVAAVLAEHTDLSVREESFAASADVLGRCERATRLACLAENAAPALFLVVVGYYAAGAGHASVSATIIDVEDALAVERREGGDHHADVEQKILADAAISDRVEVENAKAFTVFFEKEIVGRFRPLLEKKGHFHPFGTIALEVPPGSYDVELDGRVVGKGGAEGTIVLSGVRPGARKIAVIDRQTRSVWTDRVDVERDRLLHRACTLSEAPVAADVSWPSQAIEWSGAGVAVAGALLSSYALLASRGQSGIATCIGERCAASPWFVTFCELGSTPRCQPGGLRVAPLGFALILAGGITAAGTWLDLGIERLPWLPIAIGVAAGALGYGLSVALEPRILTEPR